MVAEDVGTVEAHETLWTKAVHYVGTMAHEKLPQELHGRVEMATKLVADGKVHHEAAGHWSVESSDGQRFSVNGACDCEDYAFKQAPVYKGQRLCKHRLAQMLQIRALEVTMDDLTFDPDEAADVEADGWSTEDEPHETAKIPRQFIQMIKGKPFVRYIGLLAMAHEQGLVKLEAEFISVTETLALAWAQATFKDGRVFKDAGDATPANVGNKDIAPHFARLALTRAKARCLRDALNISMVAVEEIGG